MAAIEHADGFLVADARGRTVGHVECPLYGTSQHVPDALAVRSGVLIHRHYLVPAAAIDAIDDRSHVVGLRLERRQLRRFLQPDETAMATTEGSREPLRSMR